MDSNEDVEELNHMRKTHALLLRARHKPLLLLWLLRLVLLLLLLLLARGLGLRRGVE